MPSVTAASVAPAAAPRRSDFAVLGPWYAAECLLSLCNNLYISGSVYYAKNTLHRTDTDCLWISASWGFLYVFCSLVSGKLSDRLGARTLMVWACGACVFSGLLGLLNLRYPSLWTVLACLASFNLASTPLWPAVESAVTRSPGKATLSTRLALYNVMWSAGAAVAFSASGVVSGLDPRAIFLLIAAGSALAFFFIKFFAGQVPAHGHAAESDAEHAEDDLAKTPRATALLHMAWLVNPLAHVAMFVLIAMTPTLLERAGMSPALGGVWAFVRVGGFVLLSLWVGWHYKARYLLLAYLLMAGSFLSMLLWPTTATLWAGQMGFGLGAAFLYVSSLYYAMHVSSGAGGHAGIHEALLGSGMFFGPFIGAIASTTGRGLPLIAGSVTTVLLLGFVTLAALAARANSPRPPAAIE